MWTDRHVITALLVAPVLAILAWFAVGSLGGEKARPARAGAAYPLLEKSNCRYASGVCDLENTDFKVRLSFTGDVSGELSGDGSANAGGRLDVYVSHAVDSALLSLTRAPGDAAPSAMRRADAEGRRWRFALERQPDREQRLRLVLSRRGTAYFAEFSTAFLQGAAPHKGEDRQPAPGDAAPGDAEHRAGALDKGGLPAGELPAGAGAP